MIYAFTRELRPAAVARRSGARKAVAARPDARRRLAALREPAAAVRVHVGAAGQKAAVHGRRVRAGAEWNLDGQLDWALLDVSWHQGGAGAGA